MLKRISPVPGVALAPLVLALFASAPTAWADDWPQWMGPQRDGVWRESGVVSSLPQGGAPVAWRAEVGYGYAGPAVAAGRVYLFDYLVESGEIVNAPSTRDRLTGAERLTCFDAATGAVVWRQQYRRDYAISYGGGPRCTPTIDGDRVYTLGAEGDLVCRQTSDGGELWRVNFREAFAAETPIWGHSAHPLVVGDTVYCVAGGEGSVAVAFDKHTGEVKWKALSAKEPGYCPPTMIHHAGRQQLLIWHPESLNSLDPASGEVSWSLPMKPAFGMSLAAPQQLGDRLFVSSIGNLSVMMKLTGGERGVEVLWSGTGKTGVRSVNATPQLEPGVIFGVDCENSSLMAVGMDDGRRLWETKEPTIGDRRGRHGTAFLVRHEPTGGYFLFNEAGDLISARLSAEGYTETGRQPLLEPTSSAFGRPVVWSYPAFAERSVFARNDKELVRVDLSE
ncbi:MAG: PQQ-binding-like beta-propeller repeat protein [Planctomycetota bacterium]